MADFNDIMGTVAGALGTAAEKTKDFANKTASRAKDYSRIAKLNLELNAEKTTMEKTYSEIGKLYYETRKDDPDGFFVQLCDDITLAKENIDSILEEIAELKAGSPSDGGTIEVEFEEFSDDDFEAPEAPDPAPEKEPENGGSI